MTELEAVQRMMEAVGLAPSSSLSNSAAAADALRVLTRTSKDIQSRGWHFNTEHEVELTPDGSNIITIPENAIRVDTYGKDITRDVALRGRRLYDRDDNTYEFTQPVLTTIVRLFEFECLPEPIALYVALEAAVRWADSRPSPHGGVRDLYRQRLMAKIDADRYRAEQSDVNVFRTASAYRLFGERRRRNVGHNPIDPSPGP